MATIITMPAVVADASDAILQDWLVAEGDAVTAGTPIADIETEKATIEFEAEQAGTIGKLIAEPGQRVDVGEPVAVLLAEGEGTAELDAALGRIGGAAAAEAPTASSEAGTAIEPEVDSAPAAPVASSADTPAATEAGPRPPAPPTRPAPAPEGDEAAASPRASQATSTSGSGRRKFASPLARKVAHEAGVSLDDLTGTGPSGRVVRADVLRAIQEGGADGTRAAAPVAARSAAPAPAAVSSGADASGAAYTEEEMTPMRRAIARRLSESKSEVPHYYVTRSLEMDALFALRKQINETIGEGGQHVSINDLVIKAVGLALMDVPAANSILVGDTIRRFQSVDIGVAVAVPDGLLTPVVRGVESLSVTAISKRMDELAERAKAGKLKQHELEGGSFGISNLGMYGVDDFSAILNPPQSGILAVSAAKQQPVVRDGELAVGTVMTVTLSADHRVVDGAIAAEFLAAFTARIESPLTLLV